MKRFFTQFLLAILVILFTCNSVSFAEEQSLEYRLKALYITRLATFISWPNTQNKTTFQICIEPTDAVAKELEKTTTTVVKGRSLKIIPHQRTPQLINVTFSTYQKEKLNQH